MADYNMRTTKIGWADYLVFWALNIFYGVSAAYIAHDNVIYFVPLFFAGLVAIAFAALILDEGHGINV